MSYYGGDFYRGDYYAGDPGIFGTIGNIFKKALPVAASFIPGVGGIVGGAASKLLTSHVPAAAGVATAGKVTALSSVVQKGVAAIKGHPILSAAGAAGVAAGGMGLVAGGAMHPAVAAGLAQKGFHMSKARKVYGVVHPPHLVRNRRMNVCNPRALRRSLRRAHGFAKLAMRTIHLVHPKKKGRFGGFKVRRRRARA